MHHRAPLALCFLCACATAPTPREPAPTPQDTVRFTALTDGVWLHLSHLTLPPWGDVPSYGLIVERPEGALLIDSAWTDAQTHAILDWTEASLPAPITEAVLTHAHQDKMGGVAALHARGVTTYAAADTNALAPGRDLVPAERSLHFDDDGLSHELAGALVFDPGPAHATDNIIVVLPTAGVLFGGCLIRPADATDLGNAADGDVAHWETAVVAVAARFPALSIVVPSHGPAGGRELLEHTARLAREGARAAGGR